MRRLIPRTVIATFMTALFQEFSIGRESTPGRDARSGEMGSHEQHSRRALMHLTRKQFHISKRALERKKFPLRRFAGGSMKSFFTGVAVGFGVGLLIAPGAGSETRKKVVKKINAAKDQAQQAAVPVIESVRESAHERIEQVGELVQSGMQRLQADGDGAGMLNEASRLLEIFNKASKTKLMSVKGIGEATARRIIEGRPYDNADG